ncbi:MAG: hypothetical protein WCD79_13320 [Chthoniobacteraceae bacterium]
MIDATKIQRQISIARSGLNRFLDEGMSEWPEVSLRPLFSNADLEHSSIQKALAEWQSSGFVTLHKKPECYLTVLTTIK